MHTVQKQDLNVAQLARFPLEVRSCDAFGVATDRRLTQVQKNQIFALLQRTNFEAASFQWDDVAGKNRTGWVISQLTYPATGHYLKFEWHEYSGSRGFWPFWWPSHETGGPTNAFTQTWPKTVDQCLLWLRDLRSEVDAPDLWTTAQAERALLFADPGDNSHFTRVEQELIAQHLQTIKSYVVESRELSDEQHQQVTAHLDYLKDASKRLPRVDWKNLAVAVFIQIALTVALPPEKAKGLLDLAWQLLGPMLDAAKRFIGP
jgi:hypothetical protein